MAGFNALRHAAAMVLVVAAAGLAGCRVDGAGSSGSSSGAGHVVTEGRAATVTQADLDLIKRRFVEQFLAEPTSPTMADSQNADGSWPDLDYTTQLDVGLPGIGHLNRLAAMSQAWRTSGGPDFHSEALAEKISAGLSFWLKAAPRSKKHDWYNSIGGPTILVRTLLLFEERLTPEQLQGGLAVLKRANVDNKGVLIYNTWPATGQNLVWQAKLQVQAGALAGDGEYARQFARRAADEIILTTDEGIQQDYSFQQHGALLYSGGYGQGFTLDCTDLAYVLRGTPLEFPKKTVETLGRYVLDGQRWMIRGRQWDFGVIGRQITRPDQTAVSLAASCQALKELWPERAEEFAAMARSLGGDGPPALVEGNRMFWRSDFLVHERAGYYFSLRMCSTRVKSNESGNGENESGYHLGHGATCLMRTGQEYSNISPLWDWRMIPGVTCPRSEQPLPQNTWGRHALQESPFAGGISDGRNGAAAMELRKAGLSAKKAWFFFDDIIVCLGADIANESPDPIHTTINQCHLIGDVAEPAGIIPADKKVGLTGPTWLLHDGWAYVFPEARTVHVATTLRQGSWRGVSRFSGSPEPMNGHVFSLWLDHGRSPKGASYQYLILPGGDARAAAAALKGPPAVVIANTADLQAVGHRGLGLTQAAFHKGGELKTAQGLTVHVDRPCMLMVREAAETVEVFVSDPAQTGVMVEHLAGRSAGDDTWSMKPDQPPTVVTVRLGLSLAGEGAAADGPATAVTITLPSGPDSGKSVRRVLRKAE